MKTIAIGGETITIRPASVDEVIPLRHGVLRAGLPVETARFESDGAAESFHLGAFLTAGECVGCATLHASPIRGERAFGLRGMAIAEAYRRKGLGAVLVSMLEEHCRGEGAQVIWCRARTHAVAFYQKQGWTVISEEYDVPTVGPHFSMMKRL